MTSQVPALLVKAWKTLRSDGFLAFVMAVWHKLRFWARQARMPYVKSITFEGGDLKVYVNTAFSQHWYTAARAGSPEVSWIRKALRPGDVVVDCGANNGFTGVLFARAVGPRGRVIGFEPSPVNLEAARANARLNNVPNFELVAAAVGAASGRVAFDPGFGNGSIVAGGPIEVPVITLDEHFTGQRVDFIKVDVEGYEIEVLRGAQAILGQHPGLAIEVHVALYPDRERRIVELFALIDMARYKAQVQLEVDGPLVPFDSAAHTPAMLAAHPNVHWLATPTGRHR